MFPVSFLTIFESK